MCCPAALLSSLPPRPPARASVPPQSLAVSALSSAPLPPSPPPPSASSSLPRRRQHSRTPSTSLPPFPIQTPRIIPPPSRPTSQQLALPWLRSPWTLLALPSSERALHTQFRSRTPATQLSRA